MTLLLCNAPIHKAQCFYLLTVEYFDNVQRVLVGFGDYELIHVK